jgi:hypothetical protein
MATHGDPLWRPSGRGRWPGDFQFESLRHSRRAAVENTGITGPGGGNGFSGRRGRRVRTLRPMSVVSLQIKPARARVLSRPAVFWLTTVLMIGGYLIASGNIASS